LHCARVAVSWEAGGAGVVISLGDFSGLVDGSVLAVDEVVEVWDVEGSVSLVLILVIGGMTYGSFVESKIMPLALLGFAPTVNIVSSRLKNVCCPPIQDTSFSISWISPHE
jgi:hypothetical protein